MYSRPLSPLRGDTQNTTDVSTWKDGLVDALALELENTQYVKFFILSTHLQKWENKTGSVFVASAWSTCQMSHIGDEEVIG